MKDFDKEFDEELTYSCGGDSGINGNTPQEAVYQMSCEPEDVKSFINKHYISKKEVEKMLKQIEEAMPSHDTVQRTLSDLLQALKKDY